MICSSDNHSVALQISMTRLRSFMIANYSDYKLEIIVKSGWATGNTYDYLLQIAVDNEINTVAVHLAKVRTF